MPTFLSDPSPTFYALLAIMVLVLLGLYLRSRQRGDLIRLLIGAGLLLAVFLIDKFVESPREEATRKMQEIAAATKAKNAGDLGKHLSESFKWNQKSKAELLDMAKGAFARPEFNGVDVANFNRGDFEKIDDNKVKVGFEVWPTGYGIPKYRYFCWATFVKDPDGQYRMQTFDLYKKRDDKTPEVPEEIR